MVLTTTTTTKTKIIMVVKFSVGKKKEVGIKENQLGIWKVDKAPIIRQILYISKIYKIKYVLVQIL